MLSGYWGQCSFLKLWSGRSQRRGKYLSKNEKVRDLAGGRAFQAGNMPGIFLRNSEVSIATAE